MLTRKQQEAFDFIKHFIGSNQCAPTVEELAEGLGIQSKGVAYRYIKALKEAKLIDLIPNRQRNIVLADSANDTSIPILGKIAAGNPIEAIVQQERINLNDIFVSNSQCYALKVKGDSMIEEGIYDGDFVMCEPCDYAENGAIVVALIDDQEATLKRLQKNKDGTISLIPANATLSPITLQANRVKVQGRFVGLLRLNK